MTYLEATNLVPPDGRSLIGERYTLGQEYGHGKGDLEETGLHVLAVEVGRRYLVVNYLEDPESRVVEVVPYFDLDEMDRPAVPMAMGPEEGDLAEAKDEYDRRRIDVAGLDEDGNVFVAVEAERVNHDLRRAAPADYDKMAACEPNEAIWIAMSHSEAHEILDALNDPLEGEPRVEKTYADSTPAQLWQIDTPGCTDFFTLEQVRGEVGDEAEDPHPTRT